MTTEAASMIGGVTMTGGRTEGTGEGMVLASNKKRGGAASETVVALIMVSLTGSADQ